MPRRAQAYMSTIVATGSVAPLDMENWAKFRTGLVVYLRTSEEGLKKEGIQVALQSEPNSLAPGVPSKNAALMPLILAQREAVYSQADVTVDVNGMSTTDAVAKLSEAITDFIVANPAPEKAKLSEAHAQVRACSKPYRPRTL
jgi:shikimate kinase